MVYLYIALGIVGLLVYTVVIGAILSRIISRPFRDLNDDLEKVSEMINDFADELTLIEAQQRSNTAKLEEIENRQWRIIHKNDLDHQLEIGTPF